MGKSSNEDKHIEQLFKSVNIPQIPEQQIESVVQMAADYLPVERKRINLWDIAILQLTTTSIVFWAACAAFMAITILSIGSAKSSLSAVGIFVAGAPVPLLLSLLEVMTTRNTGRSRAGKSLQIQCKSTLRSKDHDRYSVERSIISLSHYFCIAKLDHPFKDVPYRFHYDVLHRFFGSTGCNKIWSVLTSNGHTCRVDYRSCHALRE